MKMEEEEKRNKEAKHVHAQVEVRARECGKWRGRMHTCAF